MREIEVKEIQEIVRDCCSGIAFEYPDDVMAKLVTYAEKEDKPRAKQALALLMENAELARTKRLPICQDTGMAVVWLTIGQDVHFTGGSVKAAGNKGVEEAYQGSYLRNSVVSDPVFERKNTLTNTPAVIYTEIVEGDQVVIECAAKGFGSENCSRIKMCKPAEGVEGVRDFILETVKLAGPNACPPMVVGVGVGGTMDYAAYLAKRALVRPLDSENENEQYRQLERECLEQINQLNIGPMGLKGRTTALKVNIEWFPTHIAGMPVAVNINCHVTRHKKVVL